VAKPEDRPYIILRHSIAYLALPAKMKIEQTPKINLFRISAGLQSGLDVVLSHCAIHAPIDVLAVGDRQS
jgi:hypothetical protein